VSTSPARSSRAPAELEELLVLADECARQAAGVLLEHWGRPATGVRPKSGPNDLVSAADVAAEHAIRAVLVARRPGDGVLGEEEEEIPSTTGLTWVVDPLDGTANYLRRVPHWSVSVACEDREGPLVGLVYDPLRDECFTAARGGGASLNGAALVRSEVDEVAVAAVCGEFSARSAAQAGCAHRLVSAVGHVRNFGSVALDLAWAAAGRVDAAVNVRFPSPWDVRAGELLCREAGLTFERLADPSGDHDRLLAAPPALASELREIIVGIAAS
jgi:myo-inositol-1(or 4)-monophosphatase